MKRGLSAESPSASRSLLIAVFRLLSKSTKVLAGQFWERSSSRVTTSLGRCSRTVRTWKGCSCNLTRTPRLRNSPERTSTSYTPNRKMVGACCSRAISSYP